MDKNISQALHKLFERHRIVFWYDTEKELRSDFEKLELEDIEKIEINNHEFGIKYRILREKPQQKFLLYHEGKEPDYLDNWLLDIQLAQGKFSTDQVSLWLTELELGLEFVDVVEPHSEFFRSSERREALKQLLHPHDTKTAIRLKMLAICTAAEPRLDSILERLLEEYSQERDKKFKLCDRTQLTEFLWQQMKQVYGYSSEQLSIKDFVIELFKSCYTIAIDGEGKLTEDALVFLKRWKDSRQFEQSFESLSHQCAENLKIEEKLNQRYYQELLEIDYFRLIDQKIIHDLVQAVSDRTIATNEVTNNIVRQRKQGHWYREFEHFYEAINYASQFIHVLDEANLSIESIKDGFEKYCKSWFKIDQLYRKFIFHISKSANPTLTEKLSEQIENLYSNHYLLKLNNHWQVMIDSIRQWQTIELPSQRRFFSKWVEPFLKKDKKVCVIISDALRYEIGDELVSLIRQEDRYEATLDAAVTLLPSYTQLGMAALLPNETLEIIDHPNAIVNVDKQSSQGTVNRRKILEKAFEKRQKKATAIQAKELLKLNRDESRSLFREHDVVYVYHNQIDQIGDKLATEEQVFKAVEDTFSELILLIKKLTGANASNLLITADHGFIYQHRAIADSDFSNVEVKGHKIIKENRRFVIGEGLKESDGLRKFKVEDIGLIGELEMQIPKSINRLRIKGSGSRFVHGGATLQEIIIPVVKVNKKRRGDLSTVEVEIIRNSSSTITSGQLAVTFYQQEPATDKVQPRILKAGIYTQTGELISDLHDLTFDSPSENPREREFQVRFILTSNANIINNKEVFLRLEEKLVDTSHYEEYKSVSYTIRRSFTSDFDF
ncbi:BREX-1 system phosphatase PglZ type A [Crocosphaera sp. XPORK-15E]|uniref:BREX-1 system phosphatase PglZ type A n=1 Tax=Crocosphaera sp. XPORK-15E TaxID=3110247 RepID=UPI002B212C63|nr:BREX-1 system phosphatase PglZ type A [Crocosphaera sp. XPORK-15E]MEA5536782.1 BREX-1 system phosphatase PglZ type A [Crocosphaera sp. XPORK-15E]